MLLSEENAPFILSSVSPKLHFKKKLFERQSVHEHARMGGGTEKENLQGYSPLS